MPELFIQNQASGLFWVKLDRYLGSRSLLSVEERERADRFQNDQLRDRYVSAHSAVRNILGRYIDRPPEALRFRRNPYGKPSLEDGEDVHFNFSHCGGIATIAVSRSGPVGVDVEAIQSAPDLGLLQARIASQEELAVLGAYRECDPAASFFRLWTRKEAVIKAVGLGLSLAPLVTVLGPVADAQTLITIPSYGNWWVADISAPHGHVAAYCSRRPLSEMEISEHPMWVELR